MGYRNFDQIISAVKATKNKKKCAVVLADSAHTLEAVLRAEKDGIVEALLIGEESAIRHCVVKIGGNPEAVKIVSVGSPEEAAQKAVDLVNSGQVDTILKGRIETSLLMSAVMNKENRLQTGRIVSAFSIFEIPTYHKLIGFTDGGITLFPDLSQKKLIIENAVNALRRMGVPCPKVAVLSALETVTSKMPDTLDAYALKQMNECGEIKDCIIEGPISYDLAVSKEAAELKGFDSPVAGDADLLVCPDIVSANLTSKTLVYSANAKAGTCIIGLKVPVLFGSRASDAALKYRSIILASVLGWENV
jgi:phosphate butyryltransferase